jgi:hypothetical protein
MKIAQFEKGATGPSPMFRHVGARLSRAGAAAPDHKIQQHQVPRAFDLYDGYQCGYLKRTA